MISSKTSDAFLALVRLGIGHGYNGFPDEADWPAIKVLAEKQGLSAVVLDGIDRVQEFNGSKVQESLPVAIKLEWIGEVLQNFEQRYEAYEKAIGSFAAWHQEHGFKMMVLKGYACAMNWPRPEHRPAGDIDIWQFGKQKEADDALEVWFKEKGLKFKIDTGHPHHTVYYWQDFIVENHYDFLNVHHHKSNVEMEAILKELGKDDSHSVELNGARVYLPSANLHALFMLRHSMSNFASTRVALRQLLDWAFFVEKQGKDIDWPWLEGQLEHFGMKKLYDIFNAICVGDLGFDVKLFPKVQFDPVMKDRVLNEILFPECDAKTPKSIFLRIPFKYKRWKSNGWKHRLCFSESMRSAFWSGVWSHLRKPASI